MYIVCMRRLGSRHLIHAIRYLAFPSAVSEASNDRAPDAPQLLQAERGDYAGAGVMARRAAARHMGEINAATREQSTSMAQISSAIDNMETSMAQNAALAEESNAAATSLREQTSRMAVGVLAFND